METVKRKKSYRYGKCKILIQGVFLRNHQRLKLIACSFSSPQRHGDTMKHRGNFMINYRGAEVLVNAFYDGSLLRQYTEVSSKPPKLVAFLHHSDTENTEKHGNNKDTNRRSSKPLKLEANS